MEFKKGYIKTTEGQPILPLTTSDQVNMTLGGNLDDFIEYKKEETIIGRWFDGRPIYRKIYENYYSGSGFVRGPIIIDADMTSVDYEMIKCYGIRDYGLADHYTIAFPYYAGSSPDSLYGNFDNRGLVVNAGVPSANKITTIVEYVKRADLV